jgi:hypothetical protein
MCQVDEKSKHPLSWNRICDKVMSWVVEYEAHSFIKKLQGCKKRLKLNILPTETVVYTLTEPE